MRRARYAERYRNQELQYRRHERDCKRNPHILGNDLRYRLFVLERNAEIALNHVSEPLEIPDEDIAVQAVQPEKVLDILVLNRTLSDLRRILGFDVVHRHKPNKRIDKQRYAQQYDYG